MTPNAARRWLGLGAAYGAVAGLALAAAALSPAVSARIFAEGFRLAPEAAGPVTGGARQALGVSGALTAGWSLTAWMLRDSMATDARVARALAWGMSAWFIVDAIVSVATGAALNIAGNITFWLALVPPSLAFARARVRE